METKIQRINSLLKGKKVIVAFSGGVDSTVIALLAKEIAEEVICCTFYEPLYLKDDILEAKKIAAVINIEWVKINITDIPDQFFNNNPKNRCYICKKILMKHLITFMKKKKYDLIIDGTNFDDLNEYRPGIKALKELDIKSPLAIAKITKKEVRTIALNYKLNVANKPSNTCLLSRIPYNEKITLKKLDMIKKSEKFLKKLLQINIVRVRHHEIKNNIHLARIEVKKENLNNIFYQKSGIIQKITTQLEIFGYNYITLDLLGYRTGSMDESLSE